MKIFPWRTTREQIADCIGTFIGLAFLAAIFIGLAIYAIDVALPQLGYK